MGYGITLRPSVGPPLAAHVSPHEISHSSILAGNHMDYPNHSGVNCMTNDGFFKTKHQIKLKTTREETYQCVNVLGNQCASWGHDTDQIGICEGWFFGGNWSTRGKTSLKARTRTNNTLNPNITPRSGIEHRPH